MRKHLVTILLMLLAFSALGQTSRPVVWKVNGIVGGDLRVGTITQVGVYTAPLIVPNPPTVTVSVTSIEDPTKSALASVTIVAPVPPISITITPTSASVEAGKTLEFTQQTSGGTLVSGGVITSPPDSQTASNPSFGLTDMTSNFLPPNYYQLWGSITGDGVNCTFVADRNHDMTNGITGRVGNTGNSAAETAKGATSVVTIVNPTTFTYPCTYNSGTPLTSGYFVWQPASVNNGTWTDPVFGTPRRLAVNQELTSPNWHAPEYGAKQYCSPDETMCLEKENSQNRWQVVRRSDAVVLYSTADFGGAGQNLNKSGSDPYWFSNTQIRFWDSTKLRVATLGSPVTYADVHDFSASCTTVANVTQRNDWDGVRQQVALDCPRVGGQRYLFVYDALNDVECPKLQVVNAADFVVVTEELGTGGVCKNFFYISGTDGTGNEQGTWLIDGGNATRVVQLGTFTDHSNSITSGGKHWLVRQSQFGFQAINQNNITDVYTVPFTVADVGGGKYVSKTSQTGTNPGWVFLTLFDTCAIAICSGRDSSASNPNVLLTTYRDDWLKGFNEAFTGTYNGTTWVFWRMGHVMSRWSGTQQVYGGITANGTFFYHRWTRNGTCVNVTPACVTEWTETVWGRVRGSGPA